MAKKFLTTFKHVFAVSVLAVTAQVMLVACGTVQKRQSQQSDNLLDLSKKIPLKASKRPPSRGLASWYGRRFHRKRTANGEWFNMYGFTAAHRTLPFGSKIRIRNLCSGQAVIVRINDRGPHSKNRLIDVSYAAGRVLGLIRSGTIPVEIEVLSY